MKASEFLTRTKEHLGRPEQWCQNAWFTPTHVHVHLEPQAFLRDPGLIGSMCLDGALALTEAELQTREQHAPVNSFTANRLLARTPLGQAAYTLERLNRMRREVSATLHEQHPDIAALTRDADVFVGWDLDDRPIVKRSKHPIGEDIPTFNDHPAMTYDGIVAALDKTIARLQEQGN